ncbi:hypothetical protein [Spirillospora sp. CA-294931]|uniref:hypothetical protein n=1 Tax=Spirillospora sp. CA-294931 TaxID=3240042 RepID=UPI003D8A2CE7
MAAAVAVGLVFVPDNGRPDAAAPAVTEVVVSLCTRTSGGNCQNKATTPQRKQAIKDELQRHP